MATPAPATFTQLLEQAVNEPGIISNAYRQFHGYSFGNQLLALSQCMTRGIQPGPIASFNRWKELGRHVTKGQKAIALCMPVTCRRKGETEDDDAAFTKFIYRNNWFVLAQTEGEPLPEPDMPSWDRDRALLALDVMEVPFEHVDGNCLGFARGRSIAINPVNPMPHKTRFHELAHVLLGHTSEGTLNDGEQTPRNLREVEAEAVALLCCAALELPGVEFSRGYIQNWWGAGNPIPEKSAQRILKATDQLLKAGSAQTSEEAQ
jgi:hypothetical protein